MACCTSPAWLKAVLDWLKALAEKGLCGTDWLTLILIFSKLKILADVGLFVTDIVTDWLNGSNLIYEGHVVWGWIMVLLPFLPGVIAFIGLALQALKDKAYTKCFFILLFLVPGVVLVTPLYMVFVIFTDCIKFFKPELGDNRDLKTNAPGFRMGEIVGESCPQAMLGIYIQIILGPSKTKSVLQYLGIATSLISISKGVSDWWVRSSKSLDPEPGAPEPTFLETLKAALFFTPHLIFRTVGMTMCAGFLGYYVICPTTIIVIVVLCNYLALYKKTKYDYMISKDELIFTFLLTIPAPISFRSSDSTQRTLMKRTITFITIALLATLTIIRVAPLVVHPETLVATYGLGHLNFLPPSAESYNSCALKDSTAPCTMFLTFDTFANYWYPVLMAFGVFCLIDAISTQCKDKEKDRIRLPTSYCMAEEIVKGDD